MKFEPSTSYQNPSGKTAASLARLCLRSCGSFCHKLAKSREISSSVPVEAKKGRLLEKPEHWPKAARHVRWPTQNPCAMLSLGSYKCHMNKTKWHQCLSVLVPKSIGLWLSLSVIFAFYPSLTNTGIQRNGEPKRMIPLAYPTIKHFPKGTLAWLLPL